MEALIFACRYSTLYHYVDMCNMLGISTIFAVIDKIEKDTSI